MKKPIFGLVILLILLTTYIPKFNVNINVYNPILGTYDFPMLFVKEISPDRRELKLEHVIVDDPENHNTMLQEFVDQLPVCSSLSTHY